MAIRYFYKECYANHFMVGGAAAPFEQLEGNRGVAALDTEKDAPLIAALDKAAAAGIGGIVRTNEAGYLEKKNNPPLMPRNVPLRMRDEIRVMPRDLNPAPRAKAAGEEDKTKLGPDGLPLTDEKGLRLDGPTLEEWAGKGYDPKRYPQFGYAIRSVPRWQEAGQKKPDDWDEVVAIGKKRITESLNGAPSSPSIPRPDSTDKKEQGQGTAAVETKKEEPLPEPTFKPATKKLEPKNEEKKEEKKEQAPADKK